MSDSFEPTPPPQDEADPSRTPWRIGDAVGIVVVMVVASLALGGAAAAIKLAAPSEVVETLLLGAAMVASYAATIGFAVAFAYRRSPHPAEALGLRSPGFRPLLVAGVAAIAVGQLATQMWGGLLRLFDITVPGMNVDPSALFPPGPLGAVTLFVVVAVFAPVAEELVFRGIVQPALVPSIGPAAAVGVSAAMFAVMHLTAAAIPPVFVLGLLLGALRERTGSTMAAIVGHAAFNASSLILLYVFKSQGLL